MSSVLINRFEQAVSMINADMICQKRLEPLLVVQNSPRFIYGSTIEVNARLLNMPTGKYPIVILPLPIIEDSGNGIVKAKLNFAIAEFTREDHLAPFRYSLVITPILEPLYNSLMRVLRSSGLFGILGLPLHKRVDRLFMNELSIARQRAAAKSSKSTSKNIFSDPLDAIEVIDLEVKLFNVSNC